MTIADKNVQRIKPEVKVVLYADEIRDVSLYACIGRENINKKFSHHNSKKTAKGMGTEFSCFLY